MGLLIFYLLLALGVSFLCSLMEAVLLSISPAYALLLEQQGSRFGRKLRRLKDDIDRPLAAILSLNTIAHTVGAAGVGAQAAHLFGDRWLGLVSGILTLLILVLSEIIPKTVGALYWRRLTPMIVTLLIPTTIITWPLVRMSQGITRLLAHGRKMATVSREEIRALTQQGEKEGVLAADESHILRNLFRFRQLTVHDIMTPRTVVQSLPARTTIAELSDMFDDMIFSRIPIHGEQGDDVTGYVLKDTMLLHAARDEDDVTLEQIKRPIRIVPEGTPLPDVFERLMTEHEHIALVVDEYGAMTGIVTMEDIVETLLGCEIVDEFDSVEDMQAWAREQWKRRARSLGLPAETAPPPNNSV